MKYFLMHRELPVAKLGINDITGTVYRVDEIIHREHLPVGTAAEKSKEIVNNLNGWLAGRVIPASRLGFREALDSMLIQQDMKLSPNALLMKCLALSLSDQYWLNPEKEPLQWASVNFYSNSFSDDVGDILFGRLPERKKLDLISPCNTSDGWLKKKWAIVDGQRVLIKGGSGVYTQEPYNEVVTTAICRRLNIPHVAYSLTQMEETVYSVCPNMTADNQDLVSAYAIYSTREEQNSLSAYDDFLQRCEALGIPNARHDLTKMLLVDFLICNTDRHFGNFGAIRNAVTLEWQGMAPIFDSGTSMWQDVLTSNIRARADVKAKPFCTTHLAQLQLIAGDLSWLDLSALQGLQDEVYAIYEQARFGDPNRAGVLSKALTDRCDYLQELVHEQKPPIISLQKLCESARERADSINSLYANSGAKEEPVQTQ